MLLPANAQGWISGGYNQIGGKVNGPKGPVGDVSGMWSANIDFTDKATGKKTTVFNADTADSVAKSVLPESEQEPLESRRLWRKLTQAIKLQDMNAAQAAKSEVEDAQRQLRADREAKGEPAPQPRFFTQVGDKWFPKLDIDNLPQNRDELETLVRQFIFDGRVPGPSTAGSATPQRGLPAPCIEAEPIGQASGSAAHPAPTATAPPTAGAPAAGAPAGGAPAGGAVPAGAAGAVPAASGVPVGGAAGVPQGAGAPAVDGVTHSAAPIPAGQTPAVPTQPGPPA